ncbi:MAG: LamG domain-containing protein, partial [Oleiphilaceae bacterium]|nr:LamG domain-containing protein [Oleiphilaceae bacterium]
SRVADATDQSTTIHYLAITRGDLQFPDGKRIEVGPLFPPDEIANFQSKRLSGDSWFNFGFSSAFSNTPALLSQIQSMNNESGHSPGLPSQPWMTTAVRNVTTSGGQMALDRAETNTGTLSAAEKIAYLAIEPGTITSFQDVDGNPVASEAQRTADSIQGTTSCYTYPFLQSYTGNPLVIGSQMTWDGGDGGWLRRCSASTSQVTLKIEEDWALDTDRAHTTERAGFMVFNDAFRADFSLVGNYQLEGPSWNGTAGEVTDSSGTGANGQRYGDANPQPAQVCYGAQFDGTGDYIEIPDNNAFDIDQELTVMAWINADTLPGSDLRTIVSKDTNYEFHINSSGNIFWWWNTDTGAARSLTSTATISTGTWHHVAIVYSRANGRQEIFIDGVASGSQTYTNESLDTNALPLYIGTDYNYRSRDFDGAIDEVKIFDRALPAAAIQRYAADTRACASCALDHFEITQASYGLACPNTPASVNVVAKCADGSTKTDYVGTVNLSGPSGASFFADAGGTTTITSLSYLTADAGDKTAYLYFDDENSNVQVTASDTSAGVSSTATTGTDFRTFGFRVSQQPANFICGDSTSMTLQAYGQSDNTPGGACEVIEGFSGTKDIDAWFSATLDNNTSADPVTTPLNIAGTNITEQSPAANNNLQLTFTSGEASFNLAYANAARILEVNFRHDQAPYDGSQFSALSASTPAFVARPDTFNLTAQSGGSNINATSATSTTTHPAGANFDLSITAVCSDGSTATDYAPIASSNTLMAYLQRTGPTGGSSVNGDMAISATRTLTSATAATPSWTSTNIASGAFNLGRYSYAGANYSEVGLTRLHVQDQDYFGETITANTIDIGRFIPDYFEVSTTNGTLAPYCTPGAAPAFSYTGQEIAYSSVPTVTITARNRAGATTRNYTEANYLKLIPFDVTRVFPTADTAQMGADGSTLMALSSTANLPAAFASTAAGVITFNFDSNDRFTYTKNTNALIAPFTSNVLVQVTGISDSDGVSANAAPYDISPVGVQVRYGRWNMDNAFGPETSNLPIPMRLEHYDGARFQTNTSDSCTTYNASNMVLTSSLSGGSTSAIGSGSVVNGAVPTGSEISLSSPGAGNVGTVAMEYQGDAWLQFDWDNNPSTADDYPSATATFGQYRGHDRIIYWKEVEN